LLAVDEAAKLWDAQGGNAERREVVVLGALFHDVGKPSTTVIDGGSVTSRGHAEVGGRIVLDMGERLEWPAELTRAVAGLVRNHMAHVSVQGDPSRRAVSRLRTRLADAGTSIEEWAIVVAADGAARGGAAITNRAEPWLRIAATL
jgi:tRNA nucleotidyltransferase (CCA-adding enzyme)